MTAGGQLYDPARFKKQQLAASYSSDVSRPAGGALCSRSSSALGGD
jgi:hypothetical protein